MLRQSPRSPLRPLRSAAAAASAEDQEEPPAFFQFDELDSFLLDFDPVNEWLLDPDQLPMSGDEAKIPDPKLELEVFSTKLSAKDEILCPSVDEKLKNVSLVESSNGNDDEIPALDIMVMSNENNGADNNGVVSKDCVLQGFSVDGSEARDGADECREVMNVNVSKDCNGAREVRSMKETEKESSGTDSEESEDEEEEDDGNAETDDSSSSSTTTTTTSGSAKENEEDDDSDKDDNDKAGKDSIFRKGAMADEDGDIEEGEIRDADLDGMVIGSDEDEEGPRGPIRSKHEIEVLLPVPKVEVSLEQHQQMLPVGVVSSILGNRVIVEGLEKHNPLNEGSILWMTESRAPLGFVDELFGPVKNPYYIVRYNSDSEIPNGINVGTAVSFVTEFASYVLNHKDLYKKGYDASGENDEELNDEVEFSDDEKEAEYRRSLRLAKKGNRDRWQENQESAVDKRSNYKGARSRKIMHPSNWRAPEPNLPLDRAFHGDTGPIQPPMAPGNTGNSNYGPFGAGNAFLGSTAMVPTVPLAAQNQMSGCFGFLSQQQPNSFWSNGFPPQQLQQQQQYVGIQGLLMSMLPTQQLGDQTCTQQMQNQLFNSIQHGISFQQQLVPGFHASANAQWLGGLMNPFVSPAFTLPSLGGNLGQVTFGCNNVQEQGTPEFCNEQNVDQPASTTLGGPRPPMQFSRGRRSFRGRRPYHRGGRHSFGRGGRAHIR